MGIRFSAFIATSLDGYIARKNGSLDWLPGSDGNETGDEHGFAEFFASVDMLVMGRKTYETVLTFKEWPYRGKRVIVLSGGYPKSPKRLGEEVEGTSASPIELAHQLEASGTSHVYVDGGKTIQGFLDAGLIHDMTITRVPILIGEGIPLFGSLGQDIRLTHVETKAWPSGLVQSRYKVANASY